jgi:hypothetical protein
MEKQKKAVLKERDKQAIVNYYKFTKEATEHGVKKKCIEKNSSFVFNILATNSIQIIYNISVTQVSSI